MSHIDGEISTRLSGVAIKIHFGFKGILLLDKIKRQVNFVFVCGSIVSLYHMMSFT